MLVRQHLYTESAHRDKFFCFFNLVQYDPSHMHMFYCVLFCCGYVISSRGFTLIA